MNENFQVDLEFICLCGKKCYVDTPRCAVIHEMPMCKKFRDLEPDKFLRYVRQATTVIQDN